MDVAFIFLLCTLVLGGSSAEYERVYSYRANVSVSSAVAPETLTQWSVAAKLTLQTYQDNTIVKLDDVKTFAYNGDEHDVPYIENFKTPEDVDSLMKPFIMNYEDGALHTISVDPEDSFWSVNMKKALASVLQVNFQKIKEPGMVVENTLYGKCETNYSVSHDTEDLVLSKYVQYNSCKEDVGLKFMTRKFPFPDSPMQPFYRYLEYTYQLNEKDKYITHLTTMAKVSHYNTVDREYGFEDPYHMSYQNQTFHLESSTEVKSPMDISKITEVKKITYKHPTRLEQFRRPFAHHKQSADELISTWLQDARKILEESKALPEHITDYNNYVDYYSKIIETTILFYDKKIFHELHHKINETGNKDLMSIWLSVVPVVGSKESIQFIAEVCNSNDISDFDAVSLLTKFPFYYRELDNGSLTEMEVLLNLKNDSHPDVQSTGILSFSNLVSETYTTKNCDPETYNKYVDLFLGYYKDSDAYETRMLYFQGLRNLQIDIKLLTPIIRNKTEFAQIRSSAIHSLEVKLYNNSEKAVGMLWPMVKDRSLDIEIRIAALHVIIRSEITIDHFLMMYNFLRDKTEVDYQYIYSYFYTKFSNNEGSIWLLSDIKYEPYLPLDLPKVRKNRQTGYYEEAHNKKSTNAYYETQLIEDPYTSYIQSIKVKMDLFILGMEYASTTLHFLMKNLHETYYYHPAEDFEVNDTNYKKLKEIVEKLDIEKDVLNSSAGVIVSKGDKTVFMILLEEHTNRTNFDCMREFMNKVHKSESIEFPLFNTVHVPSDLGTLLSSDTISHYGLFHEFQNFNNIFRKRKGFDHNIYYRNIYATNMTFSAYNPIDNKYFRINNYHKSQAYFSLPIHWNNVSDSLTLTWTEKPKMVYVKTLADNFITAYVEDSKYLAKFCEKCNSNLDIVDKPEPYTHKFRKAASDYLTTKAKLEGFEVDFNIKNCRDYRFTDMFGYLTENGFSLSYLYRPDYFLGVNMWKFLTDTFYILNFPIDTCSYTFSVKSPFNDPIENKLQVNVNPHTSEALLFKTNLKNNEVFYKVNLTYVFEDYPDLNTQYNNLYITKKYNDVGNKSCLTTKMEYPAKGLDLFGMKMSEPSYLNMTFSWGSHDLEDDTCSDEHLIRVQGTFSLSEHQKAHMEHMDLWPFKECKKQSEGLKYTPPTVECYVTWHKLSVYHNYTFEAEVEHKSTETDISANLVKPENEAKEIDRYSMTAIFSEHYNNATLQFTNYKANETNKSDKFPISNKYLEYLLLNPKTDVFYRGLMFSTDVFTESCLITPNYIETFHGKIIKDYETAYGVNKAAYFECTNKTIGGNSLFFSKLQNKKDELSFDLYSTGYEYRDKMSVSPHGTSLKITHDDKNISETTIENTYSIIYLDEDFIHIKTRYQEIYYTKEYILVKMHGMHIPQICGLCGLGEENITY